MDGLQREHTGQRQGGRKLGVQNASVVAVLVLKVIPMTMSGVSFLNLAPPVPSSIRCLSCGVTFSPISTVLLTCPLHLLTQNFLLLEAEITTTLYMLTKYSSWHEAGASKLPLEDHERADLAFSRHSSEPSELGVFLKDVLEQVQYHFYERGSGGVGPWRKRVVMVSLG